MDKPTQPMPIIIRPPAPLEFRPMMQYRLDVPLSFVQVRADSDMTAAVLGRVNDNEVVTAFEERLANNDYWRRIETPSGLSGWIKMQWSEARNEYGVKFAEYVPPVVTPPEPRKQRGVFIAVDDGVSEEQLRLMIQGLSLFMTGALVNPIRGQVTPKVFVTEVSV